jgi:hypothetical protein
MAHMKKILKERTSKRNHKLFSRLLEKQGTPLKELGVPEMTAPLVDEEELEESDYLPDGAEKKVDRFMSPMKGLTKTVDTKQEAAALIKMVLTNVKELVGDKLTPQEIAASLKLVLKDMAADAKKVATDVASDIAKVADQNEAHVVIAPDEEERPGLSEEKENNPWAICTAQVGREDETKYEDCVKAVKKQK